MSGHYPELRRALRADVHRYTGGFSRSTLLKLIFINRTFRVIYSMRLSQALSDSRNPVGRFLFTLARIFHRWTTHQAGMDLPWRTQIGEAFHINHGWSIVVNHNAKIGRNVTMFQGVTLGQKDDITPEGRTTSYPTIEDDVWVGPYAMIFGGVTIGAGSRVGGGAVITKDVPPHAIVVGNPQHVVSEDALLDVMHRVEFND